MKDSMRWEYFWLKGRAIALVMKQQRLTYSAARYIVELRDPLIHSATPAGRGVKGSALPASLSPFS